MNRLDSGKRAQVVSCLVEGNSIRAYAERQNLRMRMSMRWFTRLTNGFSNKPRRYPTVQLSWNTAVKKDFSPNKLLQSMASPLSKLGFCRQTLRRAAIPVSYTERPRRPNRTRTNPLSTSGRHGGSWPQTDGSPHRRLNQDK
jgi:hypothetical protein